MKTIALQSDGKIIVGGNFTRFDGQTVNNIVRLNADGTQDNSFNTSGGANGSIECMALQSDGKIIIGGSFTSVGGFPPARIARLNTNGSFDTGFNSIAGGAGSTVRDIELKSNDKILLSGDFTGYNLVQVNYFLRTTASGGIDNGFENGQSANNPVYAIEELSNRSIVIAGSFSAYDGAAVNRIARILEDGYLDTSFYSLTGANGNINVLALQSDEKIIIAGSFTTYDGVLRNGIARLYNCRIAQPNPITGNDSTLCSQTLTYSVPPVANADSYEWTLPAGWTGTSDSNSITVISNGQGGVISVRAFSDSCGYSDAQTKNVYQILPPEIPICLVTVDTASTHNILIWEKPADKSLIDSFFIYRETTTNVYTKIGAVHRDSLSAFHDYAADPNVTSYRYKISLLDICGVESALSDFHHTIHLQNLGNGNFQWTFYDIENAPNPVTEFNIYRDNQGNGNYAQIGLVPGTNATFTDINFSSFPNSIYVVDVNWSRSCTPQRGPVNTTRSNIRRVNRIDTIQEPPDTTGVSIQPLLQESFRVYPNPAEDVITIQFATPAQVERIQLFNALGQMLHSEQRLQLNEAHQKTISVAALPKGIFMLLVETDAGRFKRKVVIQ
ncbi:MAG: T9SS type A sorting domain-containing protein [Chitinophagales bacterium]|nr:T9SS type A sorting domain-containing protein [Chitinophagales bacterium]